MGNFIKETAAKVAGNVTQSVTSAVIVTLITTYVLVNPGKKDSTEPGSGSDSLRINPATQLMQQPRDNRIAGTEQKSNPDHPTFENKPLLTSGKQKSNGRITPEEESSQTQSEGAGETVGERVSGNPKPETSLAATKTKADSVAKEKQIPKDVKQVQKRAEDIFEELDEEVAKKPPQ